MAWELQLAPCVAGKMKIIHKHGDISESKSGDENIASKTFLEIWDKYVHMGV